MCSSTEVTASKVLFKSSWICSVLFWDLMLSSREGCYQLSNSLWKCEAQTVLQTTLNKNASLFTIYILKVTLNFMLFTEVWGIRVTCINILILCQHYYVPEISWAGSFQLKFYANASFYRHVSPNCFCQGNKC